MAYLLLLFLLGCTSCTAQLDVDSSPSVVDNRSWETWDDCSQQIDDHPCNFSLKNQHGDTVELYDYYGKVVIVDLSAMWCGPCAGMAQVADMIVADYGTENLEWLTIIIDDEQGNPPDQDDLIRWASANNLESHVLAGDRSFIATDAELKTGYPVSGWPTFVVIDEEMILRYGRTGWSEELLRQLVDSIIQDNGDG
jgi:thiol-disulfide isomerase/thioredoxin